MKPRLLVIGDFASGTGFSTVVEALSTHLNPHYDLTVMGLYCINRKRLREFPCKVIPAGEEAEDREGIQKLKQVIADVKPEIVLCINDATLVYKWYKTIEGACQSNNIPEPVYWCYCPVDGDIFMPELYHHLLHKGYFISYTEYGITKIREAFDRTGFPVQVLKGRWHIIPHSVDSKVFYPMDTEIARNEFSDMYQKKLRKKLDKSILNKDHFVIGWVNRNQPRKWLSKSIEACAPVLKKYPDARLLIRGSMKDVGGNYIPYINYLGIGGQTILVEPSSSFGAGLKEDELNLLYNSLDVFISTSITEGWGLTEHEAAACGKPLILPDNSVRPELWGNAASIVPCSSVVVMPMMCMSSGGLVDVGQMTAAIEAYYKDSVKKDLDGRLCYERAISFDTWQASAEKIHVWVEKTIPVQQLQNTLS